MIATTHLTAGAAVGLWGAKLASGLIDCESASIQLVVQSGAAFVFGTLSHILLDAIPHNEVIYNSIFGKWPVLATELIVVLSIIFWFCYTQNLNFTVILFGVIGGAWLDGVDILRDTKFCNNYLTGLVVKFHNCFHSTSAPQHALSLFMQVFIAIIFLVLISF